MSLISLREVYFRWSNQALLNGIQLDIHKGDRIGLLGSNGAGKSTLMNIVLGELQPDKGEIHRSPHLRIAKLEQDVPQEIEGSVETFIASAHPQRSTSATDEEESWRVDHDVAKIISQLDLAGSASIASLSAGLKRRCLLAKALISKPDLLLLDEPTNHLDIDSIEWLEKFFLDYRGTLLFVTHDRSFLRALSTRIVEVDLGRLFDWSCGYDKFLERKKEVIEAEAKAAAAFDKKLAQEEAWIRRGIKARRTRNEGRVRALKKMRDERQQRRERLGSVQMEAVEAEKSGRLVIEANAISFAYGDMELVKSFSTLISRGDKIGLIGKNGAGKSTLIRLLLGQMKPTCGSLRLGTKLEIAYFDQLRNQLDPDKTVLENVGEGRETIPAFGGQKNIYTYLQDFLFTPDRIRQPARYLSGGERNRLLLAKLFTKPSNLLVLDEPTNDLDQDTLELLEELLMDYSGTVLLVSHDRQFLDNVVTSTLVFEGDGLISEYAGGYEDYLRQRKKPSSKLPGVPTKPGKSAPKPKAEKKKTRLSYMEKRELEALPQKIEDLETEHSELIETLGDPNLYTKGNDAVQALEKRLPLLEKELSDAYERWETLDAFDK